MFRRTISVLKQTANISIATGFFAAAVLLAADLWSPVNAAPMNIAVAVEPSLLLALDKPTPPPHKLHLRDVRQLIDEHMEELENLPEPDLVSELNNWTYTQGNLFQDVVDFVNALYQFEVSLLQQAIFNYLGFLIQGLSGFNVGGILTPLINDLRVIQSTFSCNC